MRRDTLALGLITRESPTLTSAAVSTSEHKADRCPAAAPQNGLP